MHNVLRLPDQAQQGIDHPSTEEEAIAAARALAGRIGALHQRGSDAENLPYRELEWVASAGLLGITVPSEYGGADIANAALADIVAILAQAAPLIGESLKNHFQVLETVRLAGTRGQQKGFFASALAGEQFCEVSLQSADVRYGDGDVRLTLDRTGYRMSGEIHSPYPLFSDWIAVTAIDPEDRPVLALLHRDADDIVFGDTSLETGDAGISAAQVTLPDIHVSADSILDRTVGNSAHSTLDALSQLLDSAVDLGIARAFLGDLTRRQGKSANSASRQQPSVENDPHMLDALGRLAARVEGVAAMVERAGLHLDIAQVDGTREAAMKACLSATSANILSAELVGDAVSTLIDLESGASLSSATNNRFKHRRLTQGAVGRHRRFLGNYLINDVTLKA